MRIAAQFVNSAAAVVKGHDTVRSQRSRERDPATGNLYPGRMHSTNYPRTFIEVAEDCPVEAAAVPPSDAICAPVA